MNVAARFNLEKAQQTFDRALLDKGLRTAPVMRVGVALDISGSMHSILTDGRAQNNLNQLVPVGLKFDDNGEVDVFTFDNACQHVGTMNKRNYENYIKANRITARGGTEYAPIIREADKFFFGASPLAAAASAGKSLLGGLFSKNKPAAPAAPTPTGKDVPVLMQILTDGDCSDPSETERALVASQNRPIYWQFVGVGRAGFPTIRRLADALPNVGDVYLRDFGLSDEEVYQQVVSDELVKWIGQTA